MAKNTTQTTPKGLGACIRGLLVGIVVLGVVIGLFRVLGKGAGITDPMFWPNAQATVAEFQRWALGLTARLFPS